MIPRSAILSCNESVGTRLARSKRTFGDPISTVHWVGIELSEAMPVRACSVVGQAVLDGNLKSVAPSSTNCWSRELTIDSVHDPRMTIGCQGKILNFEVVTDNSAGAWPCGFYVSADTVASSPALSSCWAVEAIGIGNVGIALARPVCPGVLWKVPVVWDLGASILRKRPCTNQLKE